MAGGMRNKQNPWSNADISAIKDHTYDYPYSKNYVYPHEYYSQRRKVARDTYAIYSKLDDNREDPANYARNNAYNAFPGDSGFYELALKIANGETLSDAEVAPLREDINKRFKNRVYGAGTLLSFADAFNNLQAIDMLFKYGADPYMIYDLNNEDQHSYVVNICDIDEDGYRVDATRLYVKHGFDPDFVVIHNKGASSDGATLLSFMIFWQIELAWVALMEVGANPWHQGSFVKSDERIAVRAAADNYLPFIDYMIYKPEYFTAPNVKREWIYELLDRMTGYTARDDLLTQNIQRQTRSILAIAGLKPTNELLDYINYKPAPPKPEGYGDSPKFD